MTDDQAPKVFDMPHARVTLTPLDQGIEIEVWPKAGQSAYAVVDPTVAILIAKRLVEMAAAQLAALQLAAAQAREASRSPDADDGTTDAEDADADDDAEEQAPPSNVVDLASRRRPGR